MIINNLVLVIAAVFSNVFAQLSLKKASGLLIDSSTAWINNLHGIIYLFSGLLLYGLSFVLTLKIYKSNELSIISPIMMGMILVLTFIFSTIIFKEPATVKKIAGSLIIILGVVVISLK